MKHGKIKLITVILFIFGVIAVMTSCVLSPDDMAKKYDGEYRNNVGALVEGDAAEGNDERKENTASNTGVFTESPFAYDTDPPQDFSAYSEVTINDGTFDYILNEGEKTCLIFKLDKDGLDALVIPEEVEGYKVTGIRNAAFERNPDYVVNVKTLHLSRYIESINVKSFFNFKSLESITVSEENEYLRAVGGVLFNKASTELIMYPAHKTDKIYEVPVQIESVGPYGFYGNSFIRQIRFPDSVTELRRINIVGCTSLDEIEGKNIRYPEATTDDGKSGSYDTTKPVTANLTIVAETTQYNYVEYGTIGFCDENFVYTGDLLSKTCSVSGVRANPPEKLVIPEFADGYKVTGIDAFAFENITYDNNAAGVKSIYISRYIEGFDTKAFYNFDLLEYIGVSEDNEKYASVDGALYFKNYSALLVYPRHKTDEVYKISAPIKYIDEEGFYCNPYIRRIEFSDSTVVIHDGAIVNCPNLKELVGKNVIRPLSEITVCETAREIIPETIACETERKNLSEIPVR